VFSLPCSSPLSWAGGFTFRAATLPIGGGIGAALTVTNVSDSLTKLVNEKPPADLKAINRQALSAMGAGETETNRFLNNTNFSPTAATAFVLNLKSLNGVANRAAFVRAAGETASNEADALFCVLTSELMSKVHSQIPLAKIALLGEFPVCIAKDGSVVVALQWDYAAWTAVAAGFAAEVQKLASESGKSKGVLVALSGQASPRLKQELQSRGFTLHDRVNPGPLK
ncbi:hypothetical protein, partial [Cellulosimicrobium sp. KWT-B]|uniref:hypothetical protein n=1 Tax=Cellulosimicrobium sp. KWT-B TaxID=1981152 RepID=UPI001E585632